MNKLKSFLFKYLPAFVFLVGLVGCSFCGTVFADESSDGEGAELVTEVTTYDKGSSFKGTCRNFLGFTSWDCGVDIKDEDSFKRDIGKFAVNILTDINVLSAYLVLGYVIYAGYLYMFSSGDSSKAAKGQKAMSQAFIGLAVVMASFLIMSTIRFALVGGASISNCATNECIDGNTMITNALQWAIGIAGSIALVYVVYAGITLVSSSGEPSKIQKAKNTIIYALIGLIIAALAEVIVAFVSNMIRSSMV